MASAQLMEEELQRSVLVAEPVGVELGDRAGDNVSLSPPKVDDEYAGADDGEQDKDDIVDSVEPESQGDDEDAGENMGEDDDEDDEDDEDEDEDVSDKDAPYKESSDGPSEIDGDLTTQFSTVRHEMPSVEEEDEDGDEEGDEDNEDDEGEGVGAVKIRPGEREDDGDSSTDEQSELSDGQSQSDEESEGEAAWEDRAENEDDDEEDEEENAQSHACMFCKQDEDNDPSEEFETYLACTGCGENSHQQCARDNDALDGETSAEKWKCPDCVSDGPSADPGDDAANEGSSVVNPDSPSSTRGANVPKLARDLLPSQRGTIKPDSHSMFNNLVLDEDPMDGSRVLRKRKTSSAEADENVMSLRKRRRNTGDDQSLDEGNGAAEEPARTQTVRSLRLKTTADRTGSSIEKNTRTSIVIKLKVGAGELRRISSQPPTGPKRRGGRAGGAGAGGSGSGSHSRASRPRITTRGAPQIGPSLTAPFSSSTFYQPFFFDKEMEELKGKPYGGILSEAEADTSKTFPQPEDRKRFDEAKQKAEEEWRQRILKMQAEAEVPVKKSKKASGPASQIECIEFGGWEIDTWYAAPYPEEYSRNRVLYICEFCLKYMNSDYVAWRHKLKCPAKHPPGDEIYRHGSVSVFEVDGRKNPVYCQNLCLLAKLFLGSKTLYYDVEPFLFYVLCEYDEFGYHFVGYFSKEKRASSQNNVSCILTLPIHQRKGYGNLLIDFSYLLTRVEKKTGSPEKPLSDMGLVSYRNYWRLVLCQYMVDHFSDDKSQQLGLSIKQISDDTGLTADDVISALEGLRCLVRDPQTHLYAFRVDLAYCRDYVGKWAAKKYVMLDPKYLTWTPYVMGRSSATNFELGPSLNAIAPREEEEEPKPTEPAVVGLPNGESAVAIAAPTPNGVTATDDASKMDVDTTVLESTESVEEGNKPQDAVDGDAQVPAASGEAADPSAAAPSDPLPPAVTSEEKGPSEQKSWAASYQSIPVTRFQVFPPITTRRVDRPRPTVVRAPIIHAVATPPRPKPRRSTGGSARRSTASKPKSSSSSSRVRKTGGTGRGPGRWPKGTKKSDYGNADSGPGLPPAWVAARIAAEADAKKKTDDAARAARLAKNGTGGGSSSSQTRDTVQVQTPTGPRSQKDKGSEGSAVKSADKRNGVNGH